MSNESAIEPQEGGVGRLQAIPGQIEIALPHQKLEFVRSKGEAIKDENGNIVRIELEEGQEGNGQTLPAQRARGHRKGVLLAFVDPNDEEKVCIGYSVCHKNDQFDYRKGMRIEGLGTFYALNKADKHRDTSSWVISTTKEHRQLPKTIIKIPQTISDQLQHFIYRCSCYYKDKELPPWAVQFAQLDKELPTKELADDVA